MTPAATDRSPFGERALLAGLRTIWFILIPAILTALVFRYLLQSPARTPAGALRELNEWAGGHSAPLAVAFFLLFSGLLRYWRRLLPAAPLWAEPAPAVARPTRALSSVLGVALVVLAGVAALLLRSSLFQSYRVLSGSMLPTLQPNDLVLSTQYAYGTRLPWAAPSAPVAPRRGDIVVFHHPPPRPDVPEELIKRVIGLPGDVISVTPGGYASINGWPVPTCSVGHYVFIAGEGMLEARLQLEFLEDKLYLTAHGPWDPQRRAPYTVQPGEVFVLGDNRNNSSDSRAWNDGRGGGLRFEEIRGRVDRFLLWTGRDGGWDKSALLERIGLQIRVAGMDDSKLRAGLEKCLNERPKDTQPPAPGTTKPKAAAAPEPAAEPNMSSSEPERP